MIKSILSNPLQEHIYTFLRERIYTPVPEYVPARRQYEFLVLLEDESECTIWINVEEVEEFFNSYGRGYTDKEG